MLWIQRLKPARDMATRQIDGGRPARERPGKLQIFGASLWMGVIGFGGGLSVLANIRRLIVDRRRWLTQREFDNAVVVAQMLPGGASANALAYTGLRFAGATGALLAYVAFILPGWMAVMVLAWAYVRFGTTPNVDAVLGGFNAAIVGIVVAITLRMVRSSVNRLWQMGIASLALLMSALGSAPPFEIVLLGALLGIAADFGTKKLRLASVRRRHHADVALPEEGQPLRSSVLKDRGSATTGGLQSPAAIVSLTAVLLLAVVPASLEMARLALVFFRTGLGAYGGGFAIVPHLKGVMASTHWLSDRQFADAVAIGKLTPGPVLLLATFIGYVRGGPLGATVATVAILGGPFVLMLLVGTWLDRLRSRRAVRSALRGLTPAVVGLMAGAAIALGSGLGGETEVVIAAAVALTLGRFSIDPVLLLALGGVARFGLRVAGV